MPVTSQYDVGRMIVCGTANRTAICFHRSIGRCSRRHASSSSSARPTEPGIVLRHIWWPSLSPRPTSTVYRLAAVGTWVPRDRVARESRSKIAIRTTVFPWCLEQHMFSSSSIYIVLTASRSIISLRLAQGRHGAHQAVGRKL